MSNRVRLALALALSLVAGLLLPAAGRGADWGHHMDWGRAALSGEIFRLGGDVLSPMGVPLSQWVHGPGVVLSLGKPALGNLVDIRHGAYIVGWVAALTFWWAMIGLFRCAGEDDWRLVSLGVGATFVGTHAGYYSHIYTSETLSFAFGALLALILVRSRRRGLWDCALAGTAAGLLVIVRPHLALYAIPALAVIVADILGRQSPAAPGNARRRQLGRYVAVALVIVPAIVGALQIVWVNRWMTGSFLRSPYVFGSGAFRSLDWTHPELLAVLIHPWHGWFSYHPLYALAVILLAAMAFTSTSWRERFMYAGIAVVILLHLFIQASWYVWWLGTNTFGMRGMAISTVVLMPVLIRYIALSRGQHPRRVTILVVLTLIACLWSFLLLLQQATQFFSYSEMLAGQVGQLRELFRPSMLAVVVFGLALSAALMRVVSGGWAGSRGDRLLGGAAAGLVGLGVSYLVARFLARPEEIFTRGVVAVLGGSVIVFCAYALWDRYTKLLLPRRQGLMRALEGEGAVSIFNLAGWGTAVAFVLATVLFLRVAVRTEFHIASGARPARDFSYMSSFPLEEVRLSYLEYLMVPGFESKKSALFDFLTANGVNP